MHCTRGTAATDWATGQMADKPGPRARPVLLLPGYLGPMCLLSHCIGAGPGTDPGGWWCLLVPGKPVLGVTWGAYSEPPSPSHRAGCRLGLTDGRPWGQPYLCGWLWGCLRKGSQLCLVRSGTRGAWYLFSGRDRVSKEPGSGGAALHKSPTSWGSAFPLAPSPKYDARKVQADPTSRAVGTPAPGRWPSRSTRPLRCWLI